MVIGFESQKGGVGKVCTKVVAAPPESCSKDFSGLIKVYISTLSTSYDIIFFFNDWLLNHSLFLEGHCTVI